MSASALLPSGSHASAWANAFYTRAGIWWGADPHDDPAVHTARADTVTRLCGPGPHRILELGAGSGHTAAALADAGHTVVAVEFNATGVAYAQALLAPPRPGSLSFIADDYYSVQLAGRFDVVCWWEGFGLGTDADQRQMLRRIASEWLTPNGCALLDVYNPTYPIRQAGRAVELDALPDVPGSVAMVERTHFDPIYSRWVDEWQPVAAPEDTLAQSIRCYSPADFLLLLEGTGLALQHLEFAGETVDVATQCLHLSPDLLNMWGYLSVLTLSPA